MKQVLFFLFLISFSLIFTIFVNAQTCTYSVSINPSSASFSDTTKTWQIYATDSSTSGCPPTIQYTVQINGYVAVCSVLVSSNSFFIPRGATGLVFSITVTRLSPSPCTGSINVKDPNGAIKATGSYIVSPLATTTTTSTSTTTTLPTTTTTTITPTTTTTSPTTTVSPTTTTTLTCCPIGQVCVPEIPPCLTTTTTTSTTVPLNCSSYKTCTDCTKASCIFCQNLNPPYDEICISSGTSIIAIYSCVSSLNLCPRLTTSSTTTITTTPISSTTTPTISGIKCSSGFCYQNGVQLTSCGMLPYVPTCSVDSDCYKCVSTNTTTTTTGIIICTQDVKQCPDGSYVGRNSNNDCQFYPCPSKNTTTTLIERTFQGIPMEIKGGGKIEIGANVANITVENETFQVQVSPDNAISTVTNNNLIYNSSKIIIEKTNDERIVYRIFGQKQGRFLGFIPMNFPVEIIFNPILNETTSVNRPWWSFFIL